MNKLTKKQYKARQSAERTELFLTMQDAYFEVNEISRDLRERNLNLESQLDAAQDKFLNASMELELLKERYENATILKVRD